MDSAMCLSQMEDSAEGLGKAPAETTGVNHNSKDMVTLAKFIELAGQQVSQQITGHQVSIQQGNELQMNEVVASDVDSALKHVASTVLVLAGLGLIRAGRDPTDVERKLQAEAYGHLGYLVQALAPKDVVPVEFIGNMIEDLGLRKSKEQQVKTFQEILEEFRAPTIAPSKVEQVEPVQDVTEPNYSMMQQMSPRVHSRQWATARPMMSTTGDSNEQMQVECSHDNHVSPASGVSPVLQENIPVQKQPEMASNSQQQLVHAIQELLQSKYPGDCQIQPAYPKIFMSAPIPCEMCKVIVKDTANALACDSCEKLYHLRCLHTYTFKGIPKGDWYCPKCDGGQEKHKMPKYGRVKQNFSFTKVVSANQGSSPQVGMPQNTSSSAKTTLSGRKHPASDEIAIDSKRICVDSSTPVANGNPSKVVNPVTSQTPNSQVHNASKSAVSTPQGQKISPGKSQQQTSPHTPTTRGRSAAKTTSKDGQSNKKAADQQKSTEASKASDGAGQGDSSIPLLDANHISGEWVGDSTQTYDGKVFYSACSVGGFVYRLQEYALFRPETPNVPPYIARLQALWEDVNTGSKWVRVNWCYYPADMASIAGRPANPEPNEVYESNHGDNNLVGSIKGPCLVLRQDAYRKEMDRRKELVSDGTTAESFFPTFLCRWFYDAPRGAFKPAN